MTLDLTGDDFLGVAREEFVKSIKQFLKVEAEMYPVFIIAKPGCECVRRLFFGGGVGCVCRFVSSVDWSAASAYSDIQSNHQPTLNTQHPNPID